MKQNGSLFALVPVMDPRIAWVAVEIERRLAERLDVDRLAAAVNLSPSRFSHLFRAEMGVSPMRFVRDCRMERARVLLERTFLTVKEVMAQVGCSDPSHFARDFRRHHGSGPREWRIAVGAQTREPLSIPGDDAAAGSTQERQQSTPPKSQRTRGP